MRGSRRVRLGEALPAGRGTFLWGAAKRTGRFWLIRRRRSKPSEPRSHGIDLSATFQRIGRDMKRIVLTGGPGAGKTFISHRLVAQRADRFALVPEAATQVYSVLQTRWDRLDVAGRREVQRKIYRFQIEQDRADFRRIRCGAADRRRFRRQCCID